MAAKIDYIVFVAFLEEIIKNKKLTSDEKLAMIQSAMEKIDSSADSKPTQTK